MKKFLAILAVFLVVGVNLPTSINELAFSITPPSLTAELFAQTNPNTLNTLDRRLVRYAWVTLTTAQVNTLVTTAFSIVPAQGVNTITEPLGGLASYTYSTTAFTVGTNTDLKLWFTDRVTGPAASASIETTGLMDQTANTMETFTGVPNNEILTSNVAITLQATSGGGLNAASGASTLAIRLAYRVHNK